MRLQEYISYIIREGPPINKPNQKGFEIILGKLHKTALFPNRFGLARIDSISRANRFAPTANRFGPKDLAFCLNPN